MSGNDADLRPRVCPRTGKPLVRHRRWFQSRWLLWLYPLIGLLSLLWFIIRVAPKPSRATYPCQQVAAPLASSFVAWVMGVCGSVLAFRKAGVLLRRSRYLAATMLLAVGATAVYVAVTNTPMNGAEAYTYDAQDHVFAGNEPIGQPKGLNPGRVVWVHDPDATDWDGTTGYWWDDGHTDQAVTDEMMSKAVRWLTDETSDAAAWAALFAHFNEQRGGGAVGYQAGEKIAIKVNFTVVNVSGYNAVDDSGQQVTNLPYNSVTVELVRSLLHQLIDVAGVPAEDISIGDSTCYFPSREYAYLSAAYPNVRYMTSRDGKALPGREKTSTSSVKLCWSTPDAAGLTQDYLPTYYAEAKYFINFAILKAHLAGVTLCGKNHYGSLNRRPADSGYYNMHNSLPYLAPDMGQYRALVDLMGHEDIGGKTLLCLLDGLWGGYSWGGVCPPQRWRMAPFNNDYPSSLIISQDPVAIDSVGFDLWYEEDCVSWNEYPFADNGSRNHMPHLAGGTDYLIEAALADNPPSGTFYDPEGDGVRMGSLGVHEHWNNPTDMLYSGNLGLPGGITLVTGPTTPAATVTGRWVFYNNSVFDGFDAAAGAADDAAIATDKTALAPGQTASFANYTGYSLGLNGIMVDIAGAYGAPTADDVACEMLVDGAWIDAPAPAATLRAGAGVDGADRLTLIWPDGAIRGCWLRVTVKATGETGLIADDVFYFGNAPGETGDSAADAFVNAADRDACADHPCGFNIDDFVALKNHFGDQNVQWADGDFNSDGGVDIDDFVILKNHFGGAAAIDDPYDHNRDGRVDADDQAVCDDNPTDATSALPLIDTTPLSGSLVVAGAVWTYLDDGSDQGVAWREPAFDDGAWAEGAAELGYGDGDEVTVVGYGADSSNKYITTYFRRRFSVAEPWRLSGLRLQLRRDDGAVVYLNGAEIVRSNMPAGTITAATTAETAISGDGESTYAVYSGLDPALLIAGENVLAVEIHQHGSTSSDISFDAALDCP